MPLTYSAVSTYRVYLDPASRRIVDARRDTRTVAALTLPRGGTATLGLVTTTATASTSAAVHRAVADIQHHAQVADRHAWMGVRWPVTLVVVAVGSAAAAWWLRRRPSLARLRSLTRIRHHQGATR